MRQQRPVTLPPVVRCGAREGVATAKKPRTIKVTPGSELAVILQEAAVRPVLLEQEGTRFIVEADEPFARYDPEAALAGIRKGAGRWRDLDADEAKECIDRGRAQGTRPAD